MTDVINACGQATRHTLEQDWRLGCRHPAAVAAHEAFRRRNRRYVIPVPDESACRATGHDSEYAYTYKGCRAAAAIAAHEEVLTSRRDKARAVRALAIDTRHAARWRTGYGSIDLRVDPVVAEMIAAGYRYRGDHSAGTYMVAIIILRRIRVADAAYPLAGRPMSCTEISERLGITDREVLRLRALMRRHAAERTRRRLADRKDRDALIARAVSRGRARP